MEIHDLECTLQTKKEKKKEKKRQPQLNISYDTKETNPYLKAQHVQQSI